MIKLIRSWMSLALILTPGCKRRRKKKKSYTPRCNQKIEKRKELGTKTLIRRQERRGLKKVKKLGL